MMPAPKFATPRDESRPTRGPRQGRFADVWLRKPGRPQPFMPWQQLVADVAGELIEDPESGLLVPARSLVVVTLPRQAGKSHLSMSMIGERCMSRHDFRSWYTAQSGQDARDQFLKFYRENVKRTPLEKAVRTLIGNGREEMRWTNGSTLRPHPPSEEAMHGKQSDRNDIDEAWAFSELEGQNLMQAIGPTQLTRPGAQTWIWSAGGTTASTWLAELVARGRAGDPDMAYFEWGIPDDADAEDLDVVARHHPAVGHTISRESLRALRNQFGKNDTAGWARAAGNRWTEVIGGAIPAELYQAAKWIDPIPDGVKVGYGAATSADRTETVVAAAAEVAGHIVIEILDVIGRPWGAAPQVAAWATDGQVAVDRVGPSASLADGLELERVDLVDFGTREATAAAANFLDGLEAGIIKIRPHPSIDAAVKVAVKRSTQDGAFLWARQSAGSSVAAIEAAGNAAFALGHRPVPAAAPAIRVPGE